MGGVKWNEVERDRLSLVERMKQTLTKRRGWEGTQFNGMGWVVLARGGWMHAWLDGPTDELMRG